MGTLDNMREELIKNWSWKTKLIYVGFSPRRFYRVVKTLLKSK